MTLPKLIIITGPTASGKTALAIRLAKKFNGEIISADSRQVYRGMDIGTAKPPISYKPRRGESTKSNVPANDGTHAYVKGIPHYLINIKNPNQTYTLGQFKNDATRAINDITKRGKMPFLVGGTGLYLNALINNLQIPEIKPNKKLRQQLERQIRRKGLKSLYKKLLKLDPAAARIVDPHNPRRIIRALEIALAAKIPFSQTRKKGQKLFDVLILGIAVPPDKLKKRIAARTTKMLKRGLAGEVRKLIKKYGTHAAAFDSIGYREIINYIKNQITLAQATTQINQNTRRFTRRQANWFKKFNIIWIKNQKQAMHKLRKFAKI